MTTSHAVAGRARKLVLRTGLIALAALCLNATAGASPVSADQSPSLTNIKVAILALEPTAQALYAKHRAMFRKQGLSAELVLLRDPSQTVAAIVSGEVQFAATHVGAAASLKSRGAPVNVVAAGALYDPGKPTSALVSARGKTITGARGLVGKTIGLDFPNTIAHLGVLEWLARSGVDADDVEFRFLPFAEMLGPLAQGTIDAALLPEPYRTLALQQGSRHIGYPFQAVCPKSCQLTYWISRADVDRNLAARFRNAIQRAAVWANQSRNDQTSGAILARYAPIDSKVIAKMARTTFGTRLRVSLAQPWLAVFAKYGVIPASFKPIDLVK